jgi:diguanylate cyclase (GGDEF)-like protein/PAS domain S-box-containing protein
MSTLDKTAERQAPAAVATPGSRSHAVLPGFLRWLALFAAVILLATYLLARVEVSHKQQLAHTVATDQAVLLARHVRLSFRAVAADVQYLAGSRAVRDVANARSGAQTALGEALLNFAASKPWYGQVRYIDASGMERVRVNRRSGEVALVDPDRLQDKSHRYYVPHTLALERGQMFVSPLDLNVEHGQVERPYRPMIRFAMPVFDDTGGKRGILVVNYRAAVLLEAFATPAAAEHGRLYLLNRDGHWLASPTVEDTWGFMFPETRAVTFAKRHPATWQRMQGAFRGKISHDGWSTVYETVRPLRGNGDASVATGTVPGPALDSDDYQWFVVVRYPEPAVWTSLVAPDRIGLTLLTLLLATVGAWYLARAAEQDRRLLEQIRSGHDRLELEVTERTHQLHDSHRQLALLLDSTAEGIFGVDERGRCTFCNRSGLALLGYPGEASVLDQDMLPAIVAAGEADHPLARVLASGQGQHIEDGRLRRRDGSLLAGEIHCEPLLRAERIVGAVVSFLDISANKEAQSRIRILSQALEQSPVAVVITDPEATIEYVNRNFETITGYTAAEAIGRKPNILKSGQVSATTYHDLWQTITAGRPWKGEMCNRRKDGSLFWERAHISPVLDDDGRLRHFLGIKEDITLQKEQERHILHQANHDALTDLPNRVLALDRLEQLIRTAARHRERIAVLLLDLDDFKRINDTLGHAIGDQLLLEAAQRLRCALRAEDTVARLGGDEFLVILGNVDGPKSAGKAAEHLLNAFQAPFVLHHNELVVTASIGITLYPDDGLTAADLLRNADVALFQSKKQGRDTFHYFTESMNQDVLRRLSLEARLRGALQRDELMLAFQPIVELDSGRPVGAEALLRWHDGELGTVSPDEFIPIAEQTGLIKIIGMFVLSEALREAARLRRHFGEDFYIAVNASPAQFRFDGFDGYIESVLRDTGLPGSALVLELTEGLLLEGGDDVDNILRKLSALEVRLALDDFGTGYASLSYLRRYPFDILKIDRSFVRDIPADPNDRELVRASLQMAHALGLEVVAEGVESDGQCRALQDWGCRLGQGFLFAHPAAADVLVRQYANADTASNDSTG